MEHINFLAVLAAAASAFLLGGLWSGPLFKQAWCREAGVDPDASNGHPARIFGGAFVLSLIAAAVFAWFLGPRPALGVAVCTGAVTGVGWVAASCGLNYLFAGRSLKLWLIDGGYHTRQFTLYGLILGLWL
jgi:hypothetical protein